MGSNKARHPVSDDWPLTGFLNCRHLGIWMDWATFVSGLRSIPASCPGNRRGALLFSSSTLWHEREDLIFSASRAYTCTSTCCRSSIKHHQRLAWDLNAVCISQNWSATILFLPLAWVARHISSFSSQHSHSASLPPLSASILSSAPTQPPIHAHALTDTQTFAPASPAHTPTPLILPSFSRVLPSLSENSYQQRCFPRVQDFLQSLELINSKVAANDKLGERQRDGDASVFTLATHGSKWKHILHVFPSFCSPLTLLLQLLGFPCVPTSPQTFTF